MASSDPNSSQDLKFPPVQVAHSLTKLGLETLMMRSTPRRAPEESGSSLDDSSYDLLGDGVMDMSDDDEAHTESIASTDGPTPDDTSDDFSDDDVEYEAGDNHLQNSSYSSHGDTQEQQTHVHPILSGEDSSLTEVPPYLSGSMSSRHFILHEQNTGNTNVSQGSSVIKSSAGYTDELPPVFDRYGCKEIRLSVKAALSKDPLATPDAYRILYIGSGKWAEGTITSKICAALAAYPSTSKSVMVRGHIEPYAPVPHADRCAKMEIHKSREKIHVLAIMEDGRQLMFGSGLCAHSPDRPDLVVLCHPSVLDNTADKQDLASAKEVFQREEIPCLELAETNPFGAGSSVDENTSLRVCVEGRDNPNTDYELKEVLPLDIHQFDQFEPSQLNRHLALISPHLAKAQGTKAAASARTSWFGDKIKTSTKRMPSPWPWAKVLASAFVLFALVPALLLGTAYTPMLYQKVSQSQSVSSAVPETQNVTSTITPIASVSPTAARYPFLCSSGASEAPRGLTVIPPQPKQVTQKPKAKNDQDGGFEIQTTGDHQFVLRPSKAFNSNRKKPQLQIQVSQRSQEVSARYNRTTTGEYIVDLEHQYRFDKFNVSIATHSKPLVRQSFEVMLGHNKSTLDQLLDTAKSNILDTQMTLRNASAAAAQHLQEYMTGLDLYASKQLQETRHQLKVKTQRARQIPDATWSGLRKVTAPVRTSPAMQRARMNALRVRCKMEMAAGLSAKEGGEEQSWACAKVRGGA
jgi:hypothetical protein